MPCCSGKVSPRTEQPRSGPWMYPQYPYVVSRDDEEIVWWVIRGGLRYYPGRMRRPREGGSWMRRFLGSCSCSFGEGDETEAVKCARDTAVAKREA
jgi:hypothetical protein